MWSDEADIKFLVGDFRPVTMSREVDVAKTALGNLAHYC